MYVYACVYVCVYVLLYVIVYIYTHAHKLDQNNNTKPTKTTLPKRCCKTKIEKEKRDTPKHQKKTSKHKSDILFSRRY